MKKALFFMFSFIGFFSLAQETTQAVTKDSIVTDTIKKWSINGHNSITINQSSFSNWISGGSNNVGWLAAANYNITYENDDTLVENMIVLRYGQNNTEGLGNRKTDDIINVSSNYGTRISKSWFASAGASLQTQFESGFADGNNPEAKKLSNFMAPGYLNMGAGFTYRPNENFTMTLRPANARWTFVLDESLQKKGNYGLENDGDSSLFQFGFMATANYKLKIMENVSYHSTGSVFSNYLDHPERLVLGYGGILNLKVNKYITAKVTVDLLYDHNQIKKTQVKQTVGIGLGYQIEKGKKRSENKYNRYWK